VIVEQALLPGAAIDELPEQGHILRDQVLGTLEDIGDLGAVLDGIKGLRRREAGRRGFFLAGPVLSGATIGTWEPGTVTFIKTGAVSPLETWPIMFLEPGSIISLEPRTIALRTLASLGTLVLLEGWTLSLPFRVKRRP
jgi:hypothetical protein